MNLDRASSPDRKTSAATARQEAPSGSYGRRRGRKLRPRQADLLVSLLPKVQLDLSQRIEDPGALFGSFIPSEIRLEIGFGGGEHLISEALRQPHIGFLGCEPFVNGIAKALAGIAANDVANIRLHPGDARQLIAALPARSIGRVDLLFPDPWLKRRQRKRRFLSDATLSALAQIMHEGAELRFATDIDDYADWTLSRVLRCREFAWNAETAGDWLKPWDAWPGTRYEARAIREGRRPVYLTFIRRWMENRPLR
jgi:tRNA (guanine-N7-)-methyltransferase